MSSPSEAEPQAPAANTNQPAPAPPAPSPKPALTDEQRIAKIEAFIEKYGPRLAALLGE